MRTSDVLSPEQLASLELPLNVAFTPDDLDHHPSLYEPLEPLRRNHPLARALHAECLLRRDSEDSVIRDLAQRMASKSERCDFCGARCKEYADENRHRFNAFLSSCTLRYCPRCGRRYEERNLERFRRKLDAYYAGAEAERSTPLAFHEAEVWRRLDVQSPESMAEYTKAIKSWLLSAKIYDYILHVVPYANREDELMLKAKLLFPTVIPAAVFDSTVHPVPGNATYRYQPFSNLQTSLRWLASLDAPDPGNYELRARLEMLVTGNKGVHLMGGIYTAKIPEKAGAETDLFTTGESAVVNKVDGDSTEPSPESAPLAKPVPHCPQCGKPAIKISGWYDPATNPKYEDLTWYDLQNYAPPTPIRTDWEVEEDYWGEEPV